MCLLSSRREDKIFKGGDVPVPEMTLLADLSCNGP